MGRRFVLMYLVGLAIGLIFGLPGWAEEDQETTALAATMASGYSASDDAARNQVGGNFDRISWDQAISSLENLWEQDLQNHFRSEFGGRNVTLGGIQQTLGRLDRQTQTTSAAIYLISRPQALEVAMITATGAPLRRTMNAANRDELFKTAARLLSQIAKENRVGDFSAPPGRCIAG